MMPLSGGTESFSPRIGNVAKSLTRGGCSGFKPKSPFFHMRYPAYMWSSSSQVSDSRCRTITICNNCKAINAITEVITQVLVVRIGIFLSARMLSNLAYRSPQNKQRISMILSRPHKAGTFKDRNSQDYTPPCLHLRRAPHCNRQFVSLSNTMIPSRARIASHTLQFLECLRFAD